MFYKVAYVATQSGIFNNLVIENFPQSVPVKESKIGQYSAVRRRYEQKLGAMFFNHGVVTHAVSLQRA